jgi:RimJ/RimL family protein N-acetyltransferase
MIRLEPFTQDDFAQLIEWINTEELLTNWAGSLFSFPLTQSSMEWYIEKTNDLKKSDAFIYKVVDQNSGITVGHISLGGISRKNRSGRISRVLIGSGDHKGKGYCKDMVRAILKIGFDELKLHRISLGVYDFNSPALKCYQSSGFSVDGIMRDILLYQDKWWSLIEMSILEEEWEKIK